MNLEPAAWQVAPLQWLEYAPWRQAFTEALDERLYRITVLDRWVLAGTARVWTSENAAIVAEIKIYPTGARSVHGLIAAGDKDEIKALICLAEAWGRDRGCIGAEISSRPGWAREMKSEGYQVSQVTIWKDL